GLAPTTGLVTELSDFKPLNLTPMDRMVFGGHELRSETTLEHSALELRDGPRIIGHELCAALKEDYAQIDRDIRPATAIGCGSTIRKLSKSAVLDDSMTPKLIVEQVQSDIADFKKRHELRRVVAINLA